MLDPQLIHHLAARITTADLQRTVEVLPAPRAAGDPGREQAANLIEQRFRIAGWQVRRQEFQTLIGPGRNVIATHIGTTHPEMLYVLGAHYDTVEGSPGADDNGSAVAGLLAVAAALGDVACEATVELVTFDLEEYSFLGSQHYVEQLLRAEVERSLEHRPARREGKGPSVEGALILEMIGYRSTAPYSQKIPTGFDYLYPEQIRSIIARGRRGDFLALVSNRDSRALAGAAGEAFQAAEPDLPTVLVEAPDGPVRPNALYLSDHVPFWEAGLPAVQFTDTAFLRNPHYHLPSDTPATLDYEFAAAVTRGTLAALCHLAVPVRGQERPG
jgi:aminopeptidase YwaD